MKRTSKKSDEAKRLSRRIRYAMNNQHTAVAQPGLFPGATVEWRHVPGMPATSRSGDNGHYTVRRSDSRFVKSLGKWSLQNHATGRREYNFETRSAAMKAADLQKQGGL